MKKITISIIGVILTISVLVVCYAYEDMHNVTNLIEEHIEAIDNKSNNVQKIVGSLKITEDNCEQIATYTSKLLMLSADEATIEILNNLITGGYDSKDVIDVYRFCRGTDCGIGTVKEVLDLKDKFTGLHWIENAYNYITDNKYGVLDYKQVCEYLNNGYTTEDIAAANMLCRKGKYTIDDILNKYGNGETWTSLYNDIENVSTSFFGNSAERSATDIIELLTLKNDYGVDESVLSSLDSQSEIVEFKTNIEDKYKNLREKALETLDVRKEVEYDEI